MAGVVRYRGRSDGADPTKPLTLDEIDLWLRERLSRHPPGPHYRVDGGPKRTREEARMHAHQRMKASKVGTITDVLVDLPPQHTYTMRKVRVPAPEPSGGKRAIEWCMDRIGAPYEWGGLWPPATDCSGMTLQSYDYAAGVTLPHEAQAQWNDPQVVGIGMGQLIPGDLMFFHNFAHVAEYHHTEPNGVLWVVDEEPGSESYDGRYIGPGLRLRPCADGYYVGLANLDTCGRVVKINGPV